MDQPDYLESGEEGHFLLPGGIREHKLTTDGVIRLTADLMQSHQAEHLGYPATWATTPIHPK